MIYWCEDKEFVEREFTRLGFYKNSRWRISDINKNFNLCSTYPRFLILSANFKDEDLEEVANFRYFRRIPVAVWRYIKNGCFILRTSQPTVGWFGWFRSSADEGLIQSYVNNTISINNENNVTNHSQSNELKQDLSLDHDCEKNIKAKENSNGKIDLNGSENENGNEDKNENGNEKGNGGGTVIEKKSANESDIDNMNGNGNITNNTSTESNGNSAKSMSFAETTSDTNLSSLNEVNSKIIVIDARSYTAALANRTKGGGCECSEYYQGCEVQFMNLANIHSIRKSYQAIRSACELCTEVSANWESFLDNSRWLHHLSGLLRSASLIVDAIDKEQKSVLIHCSDGWDRTPQLVALSEIMLDSYYRTFEGFRILIQREWLDFGHKFADRCGSNPCNDDPNERCPVFLQWLDCIQQLLVQYPTEFQFNTSFLDKLNRHTYSNIFATFSYNGPQERSLSRIDERLASLWDYFECTRHRFRNEKYLAGDLILRPSYHVKDLNFWKQVYMPPGKSGAPSSLSRASEAGDQSSKRSE